MCLLNKVPCGFSSRKNETINNKNKLASYNNQFIRAILRQANEHLLGSNMEYILINQEQRWKTILIWRGYIFWKVVWYCSKIEPFKHVHNICVVIGRDWVCGYGWIVYWFNNILHATHIYHEYMLSHDNYIVWKIPFSFLADKMGQFQEVLF